MAIKVEYKGFVFLPPDTISPENYLFYKDKLTLDADWEIPTNKISSEEFNSVNSREYYIFGISAVIAAISYTLLGEENFITIFAILAAIVSGFRLINSGRSATQSEKLEKEFNKRVKRDILNSENYTDFREKYSLCRQELLEFQKNNS